MLLFLVQTNGIYAYTTIARLCLGSDFILVLSNSSYQPKCRGEGQVPTQALARPSHAWNGHPNTMNNLLFWTSGLGFWEGGQAHHKRTVSSGSNTLATIRPCRHKSHRLGVVIARKFKINELAGCEILSLSNYDVVLVWT